MSDSKVSVLTPSIVRSKGKSVITRNFHCSNPNPQTEKQTRFRSVNQIAQDEPRSEAEKKMLQLLKFGRRVVFDKQLSNKEVLENHMETMREMSETRARIQSETKCADREQIDKKKQMDDMKEAEKQFYNS